ncbi:MAG: MFS transporter [Anaerolineae bacterium]
MAAPLERALARNRALLVIEYALFGAAMAMLGPTVILPELVRQLGGSPLLVGSIGTIQAGGWLLPQLIAGRMVAGRPRVKPYVIIPLAISRAGVVLMAPAIALFGARRPALALAGLLAGFTIFNVGDALGSVGWTDLFGKAVPLERRGRITGMAEALASAASFGVGAIVVAVLARPVAFPGNYVLLLALSAAGFGVSLLTLQLLTEPEGSAEPGRRPSWGEYLPQLTGILRRDARFVWLLAARWLAGLSDMGAGFYVLFAVDRLHLPTEVTGLFISASVAGSLAGGLVLGPVADRRGAGRVIAVSAGLRVVRPLLALAAPLAAPWHPWAGPGLFLFLFALGGVAGGGYMIGFMNYLLEIAPVAERATYVALANTLEGAIVLAPLAAGWIVKAGSYEPLLWLTCVLGLAGFVICLRQPRRVPAAAALEGSG